MTLYGMAREISDRLVGIFLRDADGRRPMHGAVERCSTDPHWRDHLIFPEYFHGDTGAAVGASHQTGWTGLVAVLIQIFRNVDATRVLEGGKRSLFITNTSEEICSKTKGQVP